MNRCKEQCTMINYYDLLGIDEKSTSKEIKDAYKRMSLKIHPDVIGDSSTSTIFRMLSEAKDTLLNEDSRKKYDKEIHNISFDDSSKENFSTKKDDVVSKHPSSSIVSLSYVIHAENLIDLIKKEHDNYNNRVGHTRGYGTLEVDAIDLVCGVNNKKVDIGDGNYITVDIKKNSSPGDFGKVSSNGSTEKAVLLLNESTTRSSLYYKGNAYMLFSVEPELLINGGTMDVSDIEEAQKAGVSTIEIPAGSPPIYEKDTENLSFILIDERILERIHSYEKI